MGARHRQLFDPARRHDDPARRDRSRAARGAGAARLPRPCLRPAASASCACGCRWAQRSTCSRARRCASTPSTGSRSRWPSSPSAVWRPTWRGRWAPAGRAEGLRGRRAGRVRPAGGSGHHRPGALRPRRRVPEPAALQPRAGRGDALDALEAAPARGRARPGGLRRARALLDRAARPGWPRPSWSPDFGARAAEASNLFAGRLHAGGRAPHGARPPVRASCSADCRTTADLGAALRADRRGGSYGCATV